MNKRVIAALTGIGLFAFTAGQDAFAQSARAYERANCNASFLRNCDDSPAISGAPAPMLGGILAAGLIGLAVWTRRRRRGERD